MRWLAVVCHLEACLKYFLPACPSWHARVPHSTFVSAESMRRPHWVRDLRTIDEVLRWQSVGQRHGIGESTDRLGITWHELKHFAAEMCGRRSWLACSIRWRQKPTLPCLPLSTHHSPQSSYPISLRRSSCAYASINVINAISHFIFIFILFQPHPATSRLKSYHGEVTFSLVQEAFTRPLDHIPVARACKSGEYPEIDSNL